MTDIIIYMARHHRTVILIIVSAVLTVSGGVAVVALSNTNTHTTSSATTTTSSSASTSTSTATITTNAQHDTTALQTIAQTMTSAYGTNVGIVLTDLDSGATVTENADTQFVSASIYKLYVAYGIYSAIDAGTISTSTSLVNYGTNQTVDQCLNSMLTVSDNTCGAALGNLYGWTDLDAMLASNGYTDTQVNNYNASGAIIRDKQTTANDTAKLLKALYDNTLVSKASSASFITYLKNDKITYMLPSGLPTGTVIAHKVGYLNDYQHDAGIIYSGDKAVLVVMLTKGWSSPATQAAAAFKQLASAVWDYMEAS